MELPTKMVGQTTVIVMETEVSRAHLAHPKLLLLEAGGRHGVSVLFLRRDIKRKKCIKGLEDGIINIRK